MSEGADFQTNELIQDLSATGLFHWIKEYQNNKKQKRIAVIRNLFFDAVKSPYAKEVSVNLAEFAKARKKWLAGPEGRQLLIDLSRQRDVTQQLNFLLSILPIGHQREYFNVKKNINEAIKRAEESGQQLDLSTIPEEWRDHPKIRDYQLKKTFGRDLSDQNDFTIKRNQIPKDVKVNLYTTEKLFEYVLQIGTFRFDKPTVERRLKKLKYRYHNWFRSPQYKTAVYTWAKYPSVDIEQVLQVLNKVFPPSRGFLPMLENFVQYEKDLESLLKSDVITRDDKAVEKLFDKHPQWMRSAHAKNLVMQHMNTSGDIKLLRKCSEVEPSYLRNPKIAYYLIAAVRSSGCQSSAFMEALELFRKISVEYPSALETTYRDVIPSRKQPRVTNLSIGYILTSAFLNHRNAEAKHFSDEVRKLLPEKQRRAPIPCRRREFEVFPTMHEKGCSLPGENFRPSSLDSDAQDAVLVRVEGRKAGKQRLISEMQKKLKETKGQHTGSLDSLRKAQEARKTKMQLNEETVSKTTKNKTKQKKTFYAKTVFKDLKKIVRRCANTLGEGMKKTTMEPHKNAVSEGTKETSFIR